MGGDNDNIISQPHSDVTSLERQNLMCLKTKKSALLVEDSLSLESSADAADNTEGKWENAPRLHE